MGRSFAEDRSFDEPEDDATAACRAGGRSTAAVCTICWDDAVGTRFDAAAEHVTFSIAALTSLAASDSTTSAGSSDCEAV